LELFEGEYADIGVVLDLGWGGNVELREFCKEFLGVGSSLLGE
jgi:hypothetical protein